MKLYLCGPMTGLPGFNYPAFNEAAFHLRRRGYQVINPAEEFEGDTTLERSVYMRRAVENVLKADALATLPGWHQSGGAKLEMNLADELRLPQRPLNEWLSLPPQAVEQLEKSREAGSHEDAAAPVLANVKAAQKLLCVVSVALALIGMTLALLVVLGCGGCATSERDAGERLKGLFNDGDRKR